MCDNKDSADARGYPVVVIAATAVSCTSSHAVVVRTLRVADNDDDIPTPVCGVENGDNPSSTSDDENAGNSQRVHARRSFNSGTNNIEPSAGAPRPMIMIRTGSTVGVSVRLRGMTRVEAQCTQVEVGVCVHSGEEVERAASATSTCVNAAACAALRTTRG